jgi:hypothetical protein
LKTFKLNLRRKVVVGSQGELRLEGSKVYPRHFAIEAVRVNGSDRALATPLAGEVRVQRRTERHQLHTPWLLEDGDVLTVGNW